MPWYADRLQYLSDAVQVGIFIRQKRKDGDVAISADRPFMSLGKPR